MSVSPHPPALRRLCEEAASLFESLLDQDIEQRGETLGRIRALLGEIDRMATELDLSDPDFPLEQGWLMDASSALQSIGIDRGGFYVEKFVHRAVEDLRRVAEG
jgi:hypothetical protein